MAGNLYIGKITSNEAVGENFYLMTVRVAHLFETPHPGQFAMIRIAGLNEPFLSRPFSIYSFPAVKIIVPCSFFIRSLERERRFWQD